MLYQTKGGKQERKNGIQYIGESTAISKGMA